MKVGFSVDAQRDLELIGDFIANHDAARAESFVSELGARAIELGTFPKRFPIAPLLAHLDIRHRTYGNYLILYRVEKERVLVLRFVHAARDYRALFDSE